MHGTGFGYILAFIAMVTGSFSLFPFTDATRKWGPVAINHFRLLVGFVLLSMLVMAIDKKSPVTLFTSPSAVEYAYLLVSGIIGLVVGDYFGFHCVAILGAKRYSIFTTIDPGAALGFSFILIGESINYIGIIGMAVTVGGMVWFVQASNTGEIEEHFVHEYGKASKGVLFGVLAGLCQGLQMALTKKGLTGELVFISPVHATWIRVFGAASAYFIFSFARGKFKEDVFQPIWNEKGTIVKATLATALGLVVSVGLVVWSLTLCKVAAVQTILSLAPVITIPMAYFLYKEKMNLQTFFAGIISIFGVYVLIWRDHIASFLSLHLH